MEISNAYIPEDRRRAMASDQELPDRSQGAVLFADISGFTPLTEALMRELGPQRGAEELAVNLNRVYDAAISEAKRYGGIIVGFSGDAITCWIDGDSGLRAAGAALAMMKSMERFTQLTSPSGSHISLAMKVGIATGSARRFVVGNSEIQLFDVLAGALVDELAAAEQMAKQGEVVLAPSAVASLGGLARVSEWRQGLGGGDGGSFGVLGELSHDPLRARAAAMPPPPLEESLLRSWIPGPVYQRLLEGHAEFLAELRSVVVLFIRFGGIDYDRDEHAREKLDSFVCWTQRLLSRYGGTLLQLTMGDKGSYLYATFGAPIAHEDDAMRAAGAALELQRLPSEFHFIHRLQIGISQGQMRVGPYGSATRCTYGVQGNDANIAARLMAAAEPGQILVTARIAERVALRFILGQLGHISLRGQPRPLPIAALLDVKEGQSGRSQGGPVFGPLVGRERERNMLANGLSALGERRKSVFILEGGPGIGKSHLTGVFIDQVRGTHIPVFMGMGTAIERQTIYHAWRPVFREVLGLPENLDTQAVQGRVLSYLAGTPKLLQRAPLLNPVLRTNLPENELTSQMSGELRASNTIDLLCRLLAGRTPCVLIIEDAHWLDSASWSLLGQVASRVEGMMLVIVTRPIRSEVVGDHPHGGVRVPEEYRRLVNSPGTERIQLTTLPLEHIPQLIGQRLGASGRLPDALIRLIIDRAEGHPFFSEEIAYALRDAGLIRVKSGVVEMAPTLGDLDDLDFPETIEGVITSRLDQLPASELLTLKVASVIGRIFEYRTLCGIHPVEAAKNHLGKELSDLARLEITAMETPEPDLSYRFKHIITQLVTYNLMLFSQKGKLHQSAAEWLEAQHSDDLAPLHSLLAYHWVRAAESQSLGTLADRKAIEYLDISGHEAIRNYANSEAIKLTHQALDLAERHGLDIEPRQRAHWERRLGEAYLSLGNLAGSQKHLERSVACLGYPAHASTLRVGLRFTAEFTRQVLHRIWPSRFIGAAPQLAHRNAELARAYERLGFLYYFSGDTLRLMTAGLVILNLSEAAALASRELAGAYATNSYTAGLLGLRKLARDYQRRGARLAAETGDLPSLGWVQVVWGNYNLGIGNWGEAEAAFKEVDGLARQIGDQRRLEECLTLWGMATYYQGRFDTTLELSAEVKNLAERSGNKQGAIWGLFGIAGVQIARGNCAEAIAALETGLRLLEQVPDKLEEVRGYGLLARAYLYQGREELAYEAAERTAELIAALLVPTGYYLLEGYAAAAEVFLRLWELGFAPRDLPSAPSRQAYKACRALGRFARFFPIGRPYAALWAGQLQWQRGRPRAAAKTWRRGLKHTEVLQMPYAAALLHAALGSRSDPDDAGKEIHLKQAQRLLDGLDASYHLTGLHDFGETG